MLIVLCINQLISQVIVSLLVTMESAFLNIICVTTLMTVEITVMKMDVVPVCYVRWEETCFVYYKVPILELSEIAAFMMHILHNQPSASST